MVFKSICRRRLLVVFYLCCYTQCRKRIFYFSSILNCIERINWRKFFRHSCHFSSRYCHVTFTLNFFSLSLLHRFKNDWFVFLPVTHSTLHSFAHIFVIVSMQRIYFSYLTWYFSRWQFFCCVCVCLSILFYLMPSCLCKQCSSNNIRCIWHYIQFQNETHRSIFLYFQKNILFSITFGVSLVQCA